MADVGSLGQYKVVVTADYSQLQTNFKAMADFVTSTTKSMTDSVNQSMSSINATMLKQLQTTVDQLKKSFEGLGDAPKKAGDGFKSYTKQINEATKEMQKAYQEQERMQRELEAIRSRGSSTTVGHLTNNRDEMAMVQAIEQQKAKVAELTANVERLRQEEERYKNTLNQSAIAAKERANAMKQAAKDEQNLMRQNSRILEGEIRSRIQGEEQVSRAQQANAVANTRRIQQLQTQYRVAYEEVNKYIQANLKMSEAVFIRLQGRLTAFSNELKRLGATPALANPLGNQNYKEYASQFGKLDDMLKSIRHHLTWMASAAAIGTIFAIPANIVSTITDVEKHMAAMRQVNHDVNSNQVILNRTAQEFIGIAEQYGHSVDEIIKAGKLKLAA
jgi:chromosome segregation ATPase